MAPSRAFAAEEVTLPSGLAYTVVQTGGKGGSPIPGDLIAIRFKCVVKSSGAVIDNILENPEPYYYRVGSGQVLPAVEEAVKMMKSGDIWQLTVPPALGFGPKGRSSSPGKPRVSGDAILDFTLQLVAVPGKDEEILEENGIID
jgi:FKBP-type peptidyl-prolyl cis-trans isomerase